MDSDNEYTYKTVFMTWTGFSLTMASGIISAASSALIIYIILRSMQKLSTTYHRIMTFMSLCDIIQSVFMALGTIPMPKDNIYKFDGPMLGTSSTCTAQAYMIFLSVTTGTFLNLFLSWYYVCDITFKMKPETIQRRLEPIFYILAASYGISVTTVFLYYDLLHAHPFDPFCSIAPYPFSCNDLEGTRYEGLLKCDSGPPGPLRKLLQISTGVIFTKFLGIAVAMIIIIYTALQNERQAQNNKGENKENNSAKDNELDASDVEEQQFELMISLPHTADDNTTSVMENGKSINRLRYNRVIVIQALLYILALFISTMRLYAAQINGNSDDTVLHKLQCLFVGSQGFWNMIIFLHQKTYLVLKYDENASFWKALKTVIVTPNYVPEVYICNIDHMRLVQEQFNDNTNVVVVDAPVGSEYDGISFDAPSSAFGLSFGPSSGLVSSIGPPSIGVGQLENEISDDGGDQHRRLYDLVTTIQRYGV